MISIVRDDAVLAAEVEHLLGLGDAADERAGQHLVAPDEREGRQRSRLGRNADQHHRPLSRQQAQVGVVVVRAPRRCREEVEAPRQLLERRRVPGEREALARPGAARRPPSTREVLSIVTSAPIAAASFTAMWPRPPRPTTPTRSPFFTFHWRSGE